MASDANALAACAAQILQNDGAGGSGVETEGQWAQVETSAQALANLLRAKDPSSDNHTALGATDLPRTLVALLGAASNHAASPAGYRTGPLTEVLRVAANLCMDHDANRTILLEAGMPQAIVALLESYNNANGGRPPYAAALEVGVQHLKVVRTAIGVLLNASLGHEEVKTVLNSLEAGPTILKLTSAIYPPGVWAQGPSSENIEQFEENWTLRSTVSSWAWRTISELKEVKEEGVTIFGPSVLPHLTVPLTLFIPPFPSPPSQHPLAADLADADFDVFEESCSLLESLSLDVADVRLSLARGFDFPSEHGGVRCFSTILDFIERAAPPPDDDEAEYARKGRALAMCKAALIKSVVEVAGEEGNEEVLWDESNPEKPGGEFICRMVDWIRGYVAESGNRSGAEVGGRDDLVICAALSLGNLARREKHASVLLSAPHSIAPLLASSALLSPSTDIKLKHGVLGLLKHLAQATTNSLPLYEQLSHAGVIQAVRTSGVWDEKVDAMSDIVQVSAIGIVKHMCNTHIDSTFALLSDAPAPPSGLAQILALVKRSDSVPVKSEGTRVLVNVVKSLWSSGTGAVGTPINGTNAIAHGVDADLQQKKQAAIAQVLTADCATALASLVERSAKYPLLVNEGVVALSLLCTQKTGAPYVLDAILQPAPSAPPPPDPLSGMSITTDSDDITSAPVPQSAPASRTPLTMLLAVLRNVDNPANFQTEVRMNVCSLLVQLGKNAAGRPGLDTVKSAVRPVLEELERVRAKSAEKEGEQQGHGKGREALLGVQVRKVLDAWA